MLHEINVSLNLNKIKIEFMKNEWYNVAPFSNYQNAHEYHLIIVSTFYKNALYRSYCAIWIEVCSSQDNTCEDIINCWKCEAYCDAQYYWYIHMEY